LTEIPKSECSQGQIATRKKADFFLSQKSRDFVGHGSNNLEFEALYREFILLTLLVMILMILSRVLVLFLMDSGFIAPACRDGGLVSRSGVV